MPKLVLNEEAGTREVVLRSGDTAGRVAENAIRLAVPEASRRHCKFIEEKGVWFVEDLGSSNGTLVNGRRVSRFELADGDVIQIGLAEMRFLDVQEEAGPADSADWGEDDLSLEDEVFLVLGGTAR
ncbi:MAG TPA: FHA domain-containing protein, partial [Planctomycetota bacterium]|nr:FHA domain-containing protein [Planctomycetota bacterium]